VIVGLRVEDFTHHLRHDRYLASGIGRADEFIRPLLEGYERLFGIPVSGSSM
jgi:hypothetical protein